MKFTMRQSILDRQDQLKDHDYWTISLDKDTLKLEEAIEVAKRKLDDHLAYLDAREEFRQKLVESLK